MDCPEHRRVSVVLGITSRHIVNIIELVSKFNLNHLQLLSEYDITKFKQFINESIIDLPRKTFAKAIFDKANTDSPILKSEVRDFVLQGLKPFEKIALFYLYLQSHRYPFFPSQQSL